MVRASKKKENGETAAAAAEQPNPEAEERKRLKRLKRLAISRNLLSQTPARSSTHLNPSKLALKHHGADILKKSQRKNRFLFSFPGLLAPISSGKIGELKDVGTKNPILYLDFPQGQVKLFGTIVYPKNRYLTLQFSRGGKNVMCEDYFDNMIVFSEAWWIGKKDENPEELQLEFPKELSEGKESDFDFQGGAGATCQEKSGGKKHQEDMTEPLSPTATPEDYMSDDSNSLTRKDIDNLKELMEVTPVRHSTRTSVKRFNLADVLSGDDSDESDPEISEVKENIVAEKSVDNVTPVSALNKNEDSILVVPASDDVNVASRTEVSGKNEETSLPVSKSKGASSSKRGKLVQATISTLFQKVDKKSTGSASNSSTPKESGKKSSNVNLKRKNDQVKDEEPRKKRLLQNSAPSKKSAPNKEKTADKKPMKKGKQSQVEEDSIEEFSSESEDDRILSEVMKI